MLIKWHIASYIIVREFVIGADHICDDQARRRPTESYRTHSRTIPVQGLYPPRIEVHECLEGSCWTPLCGSLLKALLPLPDWVHHLWPSGCHRFGRESCGWAGTQDHWSYQPSVCRPWVHPRNFLHRHWSQHHPRFRFCGKCSERTVFVVPWRIGGQPSSVARHDLWVIAFVLGYLLVEWYQLPSIPFCYSILITIIFFLKYTPITGLHLTYSFHTEWELTAHQFLNKRRSRNLLKITHSSSCLNA